jgi:hypothetical protein
MLVLAVLITDCSTPPPQLSHSVSNATEDSPIQFSPRSKDSSLKALATAAKRGASTAAADIKTGKLRILEYGGVPGLVTKDSETGFRVLSIAGCHFNAPG